MAFWIFLAFYVVACAVTWAMYVRRPVAAPVTTPEPRREFGPGVTSFVSGQGGGATTELRGSHRATRLGNGWVTGSKHILKTLGT